MQWMVGEDEWLDRDWRRRRRAALGSLGVYMEVVGLWVGGIVQGQGKEDERLGSCCCES